MSCPSQGVITKSLTFTVRAYDQSGDPVNADAMPTFTVYKSGIHPDNIVPGFQGIEMVKSTVSDGLYYANVFLSEDDFEKYATYIINITAVVGGAEIYKTYSFVAIGEESYSIVYYPDYDVDIKASLSTRGTFRQREFGVFLLMLTNLDGSPVNVDLISFSIWQGSSEFVSETSVPLQVGDGKYAYEWKIPLDTPVGRYTARWEYEIEGEYYDMDQVFTVSASASQAKSRVYYNPRKMQLRMQLDDLISCAQNIPVYYEQAMPSRDRRKFSFSFPRWNQSDTDNVKIYRNGTIVSENFQINYYKGCVVFYEPLLDEDVIHADYTFRYFSDDQIDTFLENAARNFNIFPPFSYYTLDNIPDAYIAAVLYGAAKDALRKMMLCLNFQQPQQIFGGREEAQAAFGNIEILKKNYEGDWDKVVEAKKFGPYPIMGVSATPLMSLPGSRGRWLSYMFS